MALTIIDHDAAPCTGLSVPAGGCVAMAQTLAPITTNVEIERDLMAQLAETATDDRTRDAANGWLVGYDTARELGFSETVAQRQAAHRWELVRTAPRLVSPEDEADEWGRP